MIRVYGASLSPFVRKVLMALEHKGIEYQTEVVLPFDRSAAFLRLSPLGKIPAFRDEHLEISDSSVICDYLEHRHPRRPLYPGPPAQRARALWLEELADTRLYEHLGVGIFFERVLRPHLLGRPCREARVRRSLDALPRWLDYLEKQLERGFLGAYTEPTIADLSVPGMFLNAGYAGYEVDPRRWPGLVAYLARWLQHPLYQARRAAEASLLRELEGGRAAPPAADCQRAGGRAKSSAGVDPRR